MFPIAHAFSYLFTGTIEHMLNICHCFLRTVLPNREGFFCEGYDYWGKVGLSKGY